MKVVYIYADSPREWNCSQWNCVNPTLAINRTSKHTAKAFFLNDFVKNTEEVNKACMEADIIIVERNLFADTLTMIQYWKVRGKTIAAIFDDSYDNIHPQNISYNFWTKGEIKYTGEDGKENIAYMTPLPLEQFKWGLRMVKGIQVPSVTLASDWSKYNDTYYVHNYLDIDKYMNVKRLHEFKDDLVIGWCGSLSHHASFTNSGVLEALQKVARKYKNVRILISGDKRLYDLLSVKKKAFQPFVPAEQWTPLVKSLDIGLAPLAGEYDKRRSWIKVLEYMALQVPWVASNYITYSELTEFGLMTENGMKNWEEALTEAIEGHEKYKALAAGKAYDFALDQSLDNNIQKVTIPLYEKLINQPYK